jgi:hypothetical protein
MIYKILETFASNFIKEDTLNKNGTWNYVDPSVEGVKECLICKRKTVVVIPEGAWFKNSYRGEYYTCLENTQDISTILYIGKRYKLFGVYIFYWCYHMACVPYFIFSLIFSLLKKLKLIIISFMILYILNNI